jgi:hypothetical protein
MFIATVDINAGDEIFIGEAELEKEYPEYPSKSDYQRAIMIVDNLIDYHHRQPELSQTQWIGKLLLERQEALLAQNSFVVFV